MKALLFGLALSLGFASAAQAQFYTGYTGYTPINNAGQTARGLDSMGGGATTQQVRLRQKQIAILRLRNEALEQQAKDGGSLTPEHRAHFQAKLDAIQARTH